MESLILGMLLHVYLSCILCPYPFGTANTQEEFAQQCITVPVPQCSLGTIPSPLIQESHDGIMPVLMHVFRALL